MLIAEVTSIAGAIATFLQVILPSKKRSRASKRR